MMSDNKPALYDLKNRKLALPLNIIYNQYLRELKLNRFYYLLYKIKTCI